MNCAHWLSRFIKAQGIDSIFSVSGNQIMPVYDGCLDAQLRIIHARHEAACVFMADGYSQIANRPGVALVTAGSGFMNALGAVFSAKHARSRVLLLSGDSPVAMDGKGAFQEMQQSRVFDAEFSFTRRPRSVAELVAAVESAYQYLTSDDCLGPAHIALPADLLLTPCTAPIGTIDPELSTPSSALKIARAIEASIQQAANPVVVLGPEFNRSRHPELTTALSAHLGCPVLCMESPRGIADPSEPKLANYLQRADRVISFAKPVDFTLKFGAVTSEHCHWTVIDHDPHVLSQAELNLGDRPLQTHLIAAAAVIRTYPIRPNSENSRLEYRAEVPAHSELFHAITEACQRSDRDVILISDGGEFGQWAQAALSADLRIINGVAGTIGGGLAYGMGAQIARPDAIVVCLMGDGTIGFHLAEYETAARENLPVLTVIGNDKRWNAEYQIQLRDFGEDRAYACELSHAEYGRAVEALGCFGADINHLSALPESLNQALVKRLPACINVTIDPIAYAGGGK